MSTSAERRANEMFDSYVSALLSGNAPTLAEFLPRCPESERERIKEAVRGFRFAHENYCSWQVSEEAVQSALERIQRIRKRREALREAETRARAESWEAEVTEPLQRLARLLFPGRENGAEAAQLGILNRQTPDSFRGSSPAPSPTPLEKRALDQFARHEAERLLSRAEITEPPIALEDITQLLGLLVLEAPLRGLEGCLVTDGETGGIFISTVMPDPRRRRFTLAHEIGHFLLHRKSQAAFSDKESEIYSPVSRVEFEASAFASYILMPPALLPAKFGREAPSFEMADLVSEQFDVSLRAVLRRLIRESHHRTIFVGSEATRTRMFDFSPEVEGYNRVVPQIRKGSAAWSLVEENTVDTNVREVPAHVWFDTGRLVDEDVSLVEESRRFGTGHVYTLLNVLETG